MKRVATAFVILTVGFLTSACSSPESASDAQVATNDCSTLEPENPYSPGTGHYAGYEWAETNDASSCGGNSTSFIEGCQDYVTRNAAYEECQNRR